MASPSRAALLAKTHKVLKRHYKPVPPVDRPLLSHLLFAACLENARYEDAQKAFDALHENFFDFNEVRVSSVKELSEAMRMLPDPNTAAQNVKRILQHVFEANYSFDLEGLKKQNLGQAVNHLKKIEGATPFVVNYATQVGLGGHAIAVDRGSLDALAIIGVITAEEAAEGSTPGMERAIAKNKGVEFTSLLHQLGADLYASPFSTNVHKILLEINPDARERLPKRQPKKPPEPPPEESSAKAKSAAADAKKKPAPAAKKKAAESKPAPVAKKSTAEKKPRAEVKKRKPAATLSKRKPR